MRYRPFGKLGYEVSALGFGCMRLPTTPEGQVDEAEATQMLHYGIDHGVNYVDSAYGYHGGQSEAFLGRALQGGYRQRVKIATKLPVSMVKAPADFDRIFDEQLRRLQTDFIDVYLLHGLRKSRWDLVYPMGVTRWAEKLLADGRIGAIGFSFHDTLEVFKEIIDAFPPWAMCQFQYNYMNESFQAGTAGLGYAASKGLAVVVMEPLLGGKLAKAPAAVQALWDAAARGKDALTGTLQTGVAARDGSRARTPAEWGLRWVWNQPGVSVALSGMHSMAQMVENVASADGSADGLSAAELELIGRVRDAYLALCPSPCTACGYCMPCPNGVDIPRNFSLLNSGVMYDMEEARRRYARRRPDQTEAVLASACIQCRECEPKCPQNIPIGDWMPQIHAVLGEGQPYVARDCPRP